MCGEIRLCTFVRFVRYVITTIRACYALLRSRSALCLYGFCRMALQLLGTLERRRGALCPFAFLLTMEKLQLYSPRRLCYNSLVLGVSRCTGQEISACRDASFGRSKLGRSKLGRNGDRKGAIAPSARLKRTRIKKELCCEQHGRSETILNSQDTKSMEVSIGDTASFRVFLYRDRHGMPAMVQQEQIDV